MDDHPAYKRDAYKKWSLADLNMWVTLLIRRSYLRSDTPEGIAGCEKDLKDAEQYQKMANDLMRGSHGQGNGRRR